MANDKAAEKAAAEKEAAEKEAAEKEAAKKAAAEKNDGLLVMIKDGEDPIRVHPNQVGPWEKQGWSLENMEESE